MLEVPLLLMVAGIILAILLPKLPPMGGKVLVAAVGLVVIVGLYYLMVVPGWQPGEHALRSRRYIFIRFGLAAVLVVSAVIGYILLT